MLIKAQATLALRALRHTGIDLLTTPPALHHCPDDDWLVSVNDLSNIPEGAKLLHPGNAPILRKDSPLPKDNSLCILVLD